MDYEKKSFLVYFDNCRMLKRLPLAECGAVVLAVAEYAERLSRGQDGEPYLREQLAQLPSDAAMALEFMAANARRDGQRYQQTCTHHAEWKARRKGASRQKTDQFATDQADELAARNADVLRFI